MGSWDDVSGLLLVIAGGLLAKGVAIKNVALRFMLVERAVWERVAGTGSENMIMLEGVRLRLSSSRATPGLAMITSKSCSVDSLVSVPHQLMCDKGVVDLLLGFDDLWHPMLVLCSTLSGLRQRP